MITSLCTKLLEILDPNRRYYKEYEEKYFDPDIPDTFRPKVAFLKRVQDFYRQFETEEAKHRLEVLRELSLDLRKDGIEATFLVGGSLAFGMSEKESDFDITYAGDVSWYGSSKNYHTGLANLHPFLVERLSLMMGRPVEVCKESMSSELMMPVIRKQVSKNHRYYYPLDRSPMQWFYESYYVNRLIDDSLDGVIVKIEELRKSNLKVDVALRECHFPLCYDKSLKKYHQRLAMNGIDVPQEVVEMELEIVNEWDRTSFLKDIEGLN